LTRAGATSIPIDSATPNYAYTSAAVLTSPATTLVTAVTYNGPTSLTAGTAATTNVASADAVIGTDDTTAFQAAINAAYSAQTILVRKPPGPVGYAYLITGPLTQPQQALLFTGASGQGAQIWYAGHSSLFEIGTDDGNAYDSNESEAGALAIYS
jgi:hypothetical protein